MQDTQIPAPQQNSPGESLAALSRLEAITMGNVATVIRLRKEMGFAP